MASAFMSELPVGDTRDVIGRGGGPPPRHAVPVSYQVNWEIQALD